MGLRILIVEDEQIIAADLEMMLTGMGHRVVGTAISGEEAVKIAEQERPEVILMDVQLEGEMTGVQAARIVQQQIGAKIIYMTAFPTVALQESIRTGEPTVCVGKPFSRIQLEAALEL